GQMHPVLDRALGGQPQQGHDGREHADPDENHADMPGARLGARPRGKTGQAITSCSGIRYRFRPTLSTSSLASLRCLAISVSGRLSTCSVPKLATTGSSATPDLTGYS